MALHYDGEVRIVKVNMGPFMNNGYIVSCPETNEGILIDTPAEPELLLNEVGDVSIKAILITHNHQDHLLGFDEITGSLNAPWVSPLPTRDRSRRLRTWSWPTARSSASATRS